MPVFLSTDDGRVLLADLAQRRTVEMADFRTPLTGLAIASGERVYGSTGTGVFLLDMTGRDGDDRRLTQVASVTAGGGIAGIDVDGSDRILIGTVSGLVWRQERDESLTRIGQFPDGIEGGIARIGGFAFAVGQTGVLSVMSIRTGEVSELIYLGLGRVEAICAQDRVLRLTVIQGSGQTQFFLYDADAGTLVHETGLLGSYDRITGSASGDLGNFGFIGTVQDDPFVGTPYGDTMSGNGGDDRLYGRDGNDLLMGGDNDDLLMGEDGDDTLDGGAGDDAFYGGPGSDWAVLGGAPLRVDLFDDTPQQTGQGRDFFEEIENLRGGAFADWFAGTSWDNILEGQGGDDTLLGRDGNDTLRGGGGDDYLRGGDGDDVMDGGDGFDMVSYAGDIGVTVSLNRLYAQDTGRGMDVLRNVEGVSGSSGNDRLIGNDADNRLEGNSGFDTLCGGGNDSLFGLRGFDSLSGGAGSDYLDGGGGDDTLDGGTGPGIDTAWGGLGADTFVFTVQDPDGSTGTRLIILDFAPGDGDVIQLVGGSPEDFSGWTLLSTAGGTLVGFGNGTELFIAGTAPAEVESAWFA
ncbi:calcium-binding protein [Mangrovicoccus sp. HB161399]|uniref:calcium-binding protein n=1 Tax=Mangrovicoccus sp. HB161399 TaxID=2720392 RepID=UPI0015574527|nr:calcium-binding protein [Mangrovicoccus sp. HB161399]